MSYILFVNPQILAQAGMPVADVTIATALSAALATLVMGLFARYPFALAPGMGLNAYFAFGVVVGLGVSYQVALAAVFVEGLIFLLLSIGHIRTAIINAIPQSLKIATTTGIGLFLALIGLQNAGIIAAHPSTLVTLGDIQALPTLLALGGLFLTAALVARRIPGAILWGITIVTGMGWVLHVAALPSSLFSLPSFPSQTFLAFDFSQLLSGQFFAVVLAFLFVDLFDTAGTLLGVGRLGGFLDENGRLPRASRAFSADALGTTFGAMLGTSAVTSYIESGTGIEAGGRTGLTAVVVSLFFLAALFFVPLITSVPAIATAPALIVVGAMMMKAIREVPWNAFEESIPAFLTMVVMPFTYSIANGIAFGIFSYVLLKVLTGKAKEVHGIMYILAVLLFLYYGFLAGKA